MLKKRQLEDAGRCIGLTCDYCKLYNNIIKHWSQNCTQLVAQTALTYRAMLERLDSENSVCPICGLDKEYGHEKGCELAALLKESEG